MSQRAWWLPLLLSLSGCASSAEDAVHAEARVASASLPPAAVAELLRAQPVSVDGPDPSGGLRVIASHDALDQLRALGLNVELLQEDHRRPAGHFPDYHDVDQMAEALRDLADAYPDRAELLDLGRSVDGRPLLGLRIGEGDWRVRLLAAHHGDELTSAELAIAMARQLVEAELEAEVWIVPHVNPDGVHEGSRYNARSVDLNRNYGYHWSAEEYRAGDAPFSEPESRAMRVLASYRGFASGLSMHAGAALICYVWNYTTDAVPDRDLLIEHEEAYRDRCGIGSFYVINGGDWYITYGDTTDWSYGRQGTLDHTLEVSVDKSPPAGQLQGIIDDHRDAVMHFVQREPDLRGLVRDAVDDSALEATVTVDGAWDVVTGPDGRFARWLPEHADELIVEAPGYANAVVELGGDPSELLEIELAREDLVSLRPEPALLTWSDSEREVLVPGASDGALTLFRPGYASVTIERSGDGYGVVSAELEPGPWGILGEQGVAPRSLFVGERDDRVALTEVEWDDGIIEVRGQGFELGTRAWAIGGEGRALHPLALDSFAGDRLVLDATPMAALDGVIDLLVVSSGAQLVALDLASGATVDTAAPPDTDHPGDDSWPAADSDTPVIGRPRCGCGTTSNGRVAPALFLVTLACVASVRRRARNPGRDRVSQDSGADLDATTSTAPLESP